MDLPLPYSVRSARHHFRNLLGVIRGFSELMIEGLVPESPSKSHLEFSIETCDRVQKFVDRVLCSEEVLKRQEWKQPFWINLQHDTKSILKTVDALILLHSEAESKETREDLLKMKKAGEEILAYGQEFITYTFAHPVKK